MELSPTMKALRKPYGKIGLELDIETPILKRLDQRMFLSKFCELLYVEQTYILIANLTHQ